MKLPEFMEQLRKDNTAFEKFYQVGIDGPDPYYEEMDEGEWYEQFLAWLSMQGPS